VVWNEICIFRSFLTRLSTTSLVACRFGPQRWHIAVVVLSLRVPRTGQPGHFGFSPDNQRPTSPPGSEHTHVRTRRRQSKHTDTSAPFTRYCVCVCVCVCKRNTYKRIVTFSQPVCSVYTRAPSSRLHTYSGSSIRLN
jgi:hypothetical protein